MKITYVSDFLNHHTLFLAQELYNILGKNFYFIETENANKKNNAFKLGYAYYEASRNMANEFEWCLRSYIPEQYNYCEKIIMESDAVIIGNTSDDLILNRLKKGLLTFRAHERWYKKKIPFYKIPKAKLGGYIHHSRYKGLRMLAASAYTAADASMAGCFKNKVYKWGYFPELRTYNNLNIKRNNKTPTLLWSGRFVDWKHADDAIRAAVNLKNNGYSFKLKILGSGDEEEILKKMVYDNKLCKIVDFLGAASPNHVRDIMEESDIFLFTSDFNEGWGVVLNEAMNSGCAVIASHAAGATPFLVRHKDNGLIYKSGSIEELTKCIENLVNNENLRKQYGAKAYDTICNMWSPENAAKRLICLTNDLLSNKEVQFSDGVCSRAPVIKNDWMEK